MSGTAGYDIDAHRNDRGKRSSVAAVLFGLLAACGVVAAQSETERPVDPAIEERIRVEYTLIDFIVLDAEGRPVSDVTLEDLRLKVGGRKIPIATLDRDCAEGPRAARDATPGEVPAESRPPDGAEPRRIVLVFDYDHMDETAEVFEHAQRLMSERVTGSEQIMLVSFSEVVRLETRFTADVDELRWALRRMRNDRDLFARYRSRLTEIEFFERVRALFDLLERWPGRKTVVLFSGPFLRDGFSHDEQFREVAALASATRTSVYPVDTAGLRTDELPPDAAPSSSDDPDLAVAPPRQSDPLDLPARDAPYAPEFGGPPELRRLANETGGRMTSETNDIGLAYEQARRDTSCVYTLGFRDPRLELDRDRNVLLKIVGRAGLRVVYPDRYVVRSEEEQRESMVRTAALAPHVFESPDVRGELFVVGARSGNWDSLIGTEIRLDPGSVQVAGERWELLGFLRRPDGTVVHKFELSVAMPDAGRDRSLSASFFEPFAAPPGDYALSVVLSVPGGGPRASTRPIRLPAVPQRGPFLLGPILGQRTEASFEPRMRLHAFEGQPLDALTVFCVAGLSDPATPSTVSRRLTDLAGNELRRFDEASVDLAGGDPRCHQVIDPLGTETLAPGSYEIRARGAAGEWVTEETGTEFTIEPRGGTTSGP